jgi:potassium efflux system protein
MREPKTSHVVAFVRNCAASIVLFFPVQTVARHDEPAGQREPAQPTAEAIPLEPAPRSPATDSTPHGGNVPRASAATGSVSSFADHTSPTAKPGSSISGTKPGSSKSATKPGSSELSSILADRQRILDEHDQAAKELRELGQSVESPEGRLSSARSDLAQLEAQLAEPVERLLPASFKAASGQLTDALRGELKETIETVGSQLRDAQNKVEAARAEQGSAGGKQAVLRAERDKLFQRAANSTARVREREDALGAARTAEARSLAQERLTNLRMEARVDALRLQVVEAKLAREAKLGAIRELDRQRFEARSRLTRNLLELMQARFLELAESRSRDLEEASARQENKARQSDDPLVRYRARRTADLLDLEAMIIKHEQALATKTHPALEEERTLADRAEADFAEIKQLLADGNVSRLDALRLNNDFRRIGPERDRLLRNELATIEAQLQFYENILTNVELELIEGSMADQIEHDAVMERLPAQRHGEAQTEFAGLDQRHKDLLMRRKAALTKLVARAAETLEQVNRRLHVLEDEYGFIRTNIFWVRDQEPIGAASVIRTGHELRMLARGLIKLVRESCTRDSWAQQTSTEFMAAAAAAAILPLGLFRLRRMLRRRITRALPPTHLHGTAVEVIRVDMNPARRQA